MKFLKKQMKWRWEWEMRLLDLIENEKLIIENYRIGLFEKS